MLSGDPPKGDLPIAFLERDLAGRLRTKTQLVRLTQKTVQKQRGKHKYLIADDYRHRLPAVLRDAQVVTEESGHYGRSGDRDLAFFLEEDGRLWKAVVSAQGERRVRLATFYESNLNDFGRTLARGKVVRDLRK